MRIEDRWLSDEKWQNVYQPSLMSYKDNFNLKDVIVSWAVLLMLYFEAAYIFRFVLKCK